MEFYFPSGSLQEGGGSKQLHWLGRWNYYFFFGCTKQLLEQQFLVRSLLGGTLRRDPQEESSGGTVGGEAAKTIRGGRVDRERLWGFSPPGRLRAMVHETRGRCGERGRAGVSHSGNVGGGGAVAASLC